MNKLGTSFLTPSLYPPTTVTCWFKWAAFGSYSPLKFVCPYRVKKSTNSIAWVVLLPLSTGCLTASKPLWWIAGHRSLLNCIHHYLPLLTNPVQKKRRVTHAGLRRQPAPHLLMRRWRRQDGILLVQYQVGNQGIGHRSCIWIGEETRQSKQCGFSIYTFDNSKSKSMVRLVRAEKMVLSGLVFARKIARMILIQNI